MRRRSPTRSATPSAPTSAAAAASLATFADVALRRDRASADGLRPGRPVRRVVRRPHRRADAELVSEPRRRSRDRRHPVLDGLDDAPRIINGVFRVDVRPDGDFPSPVTLIPSYPDLPMEDVYPRVPHTDDARALPARARTEAASSTFRGTSIARSGRCCASTTAAAAQRDPVGDERAAAGRGRRARRARRHRLASARLDDGAPREPDEPDDDEGGRPSEFR